MAAGNNKVTRPAKRIPRFTSNDDLTNAFLKGGDLTEEQQRKYDRNITIWTWILEQPRSVVRDLVMKEFCVARAQAYRLIDQAEEFFGEIQVVRVEAERLKQMAWLEALINDPNTKPVDKNRAIKTHSEITGTNRHSDTAEKPAEMPVFWEFTDDPMVLMIEEADLVEFEEDD